MLAQIIEFLSKMSIFMNVIVTPVLLCVILQNMMHTNHQLQAFNQLIVTMQTIDNTTLSQTTSIEQLIRIMTAAATGKAIAGLNI
jgi:mannitol/fructose-specific phosphotransferase system IIA component (Ntr-type)